MPIMMYALQISMGAISISTACCIYRLVVGPSLVDRLLALDTLFLNAVCFMVVAGIYWATTHVFEAALLLTMLGFISTLALARYFTSGMVID